jgi:hypothetical protein
MLGQMPLASVGLVDSSKYVYKNANLLTFDTFGYFKGHNVRSQSFKIVFFCFECGYFENNFAEEL